MKDKEEYITYLHKKIDDWNRDIDKLMDKADRIDTESRVELDNQIQTLKRKRGEIEAKNAALSQSGTAAWEDIKSGIDLAGEGMSTTVKSATARLFK